MNALVFDPSRCGPMSMEKRRELVYEVSQWPDSAMEMLQTWSRQDILQILCLELGKERKYTGLTKSKIIEQLLKIVYEKKSQVLGTETVSLENVESTPKRQRKSDHPNHLLVAPNGVEYVAPDVDSGNPAYCKNSACKAKLNHGDTFCKRCSCCICHQYDDNKDPSLWLICNSDPPFHGVSCGMSCHLECALRHENSGILQDRQDKGLDGSFCCVYCGKVNDLLSSWRKQLVVASDTRRVDILCYRLSLGQKILTGTKHYQNLYRITDEAVKKLEEDFGPLTGLPVKKARGIVNRLSSGPEIQRLCTSAVESLDLMLSNRVSDMPSDCNTLASKLVRFEDIRASSLTVIVNSDYSNMGNVVGYSLWHRKADNINYPAEPTCRLFRSNTKVLLSGLSPDTQYFLKVVILDTDREMGFCEFQFRTGNKNSNSVDIERSQSPATNCSSLSNPSSVEDETNNNLVPCNSYLPSGTAKLPAETIERSNRSQKEDAPGNVASLLDQECSLGKISFVPNGDNTLLNMNNKESSNGQMVKEARSSGNASDMPVRTGLECVPYVDSSQTALPITPCKFENAKDDNGRINNRPKSGAKDKGIDNGFNRDAEPQAGSSSKKRSVERRDEECAGVGDKDFEYYVKAVRWLECDGFIETSFRQKFLTWYSLRATPQEIRVVKVFIDTFIEDPESLAGQLVHSFSDVVSNKRCCAVPAGFCMKLWH